MFLGKGSGFFLRKALGSRVRKKKGVEESCRCDCVCGVIQRFSIFGFLILNIGEILCDCSWLFI